MSASLHRVTFGILAAFLALALGTGYWSLARGSELTARDDNPRYVLAEARVRRGPILDRTGTPLAQTDGQPGDYTRIYPVPPAAPAVGYATLRYGVAGIEEALDGVLRGDLAAGSWEAEWELGALGRPQIGRAVRLTLEADVQRAAAAALAGEVGAVVALDPLTGEVLAMASAPTFDANRLEEQWEALLADPRAPLLNRATFGSYQPGGALQAVVLAAALERDLAAPDDLYPNGAEPLTWQGAEFGCAAGPPARLTLQAALAAACPAPFASLGQRLGADGLGAALVSFGLYDAPQFSLPAVASEQVPILDARLAAAGQGHLRVSPLQMALVAAAFANRGTHPPLRIVAEVQTDLGAGDGQWAAQAALGHSRSAVSATVAEAVAGLFPRHALGGVEAAGQAALALTGPAAEQVAWYLAFAPADNPVVAIAVLVERATPARAESIGNEVLQAALGQ